MSETSETLLRLAAASAQVARELETQAETLRKSSAELYLQGARAALSEPVQGEQRHGSYSCEEEAEAAFNREDARRP